MLTGIEGEIDNKIVVGVSDVPLLTLEGWEEITEETLDMR